MKRTLKKSCFGLGTLLDKLNGHILQAPDRRDPDEIDMIIVTGDGVMVNNTFYNKEHIEELVDKALESQRRKDRPVINAQGDARCRLPEIGSVVRRYNGVIEIGGIEIQKKSWLHGEITRLFVQQRII